MKFILLTITFILFSCKGEAQQQKESQNSDFEVSKSDATWKNELTDAAYRVLRKGATERAFSSELNNITEPGVFVCAGCGNELYRTRNKFKSGTGWPSFDRAIKGAVAYGSGNIGYQGVEVHCGRCGGHLGHVFNDGPQETTGKRHCINGVAMEFIPSEEKNE